MFPRIIFNVAQSSVRRGLSEDGTRFQIPFQLAKKFGPIDLDFEFGPLASTVGRSELLYGVVGGREVSKKTSLMLEFHGTSRTNFSRDTSDGELRLAPQDQRARHLDCLVRPRAARAEDEQLAFIGYCGVQLLY